MVYYTVTSLHASLNVASSKRLLCLGSRRNKKSDACQELLREELMHRDSSPLTSRRSFFLEAAAPLATELNGCTPFILIKGTSHYIFARHKILVWRKCAVSQDAGREIHRLREEVSSLRERISIQDNTLATLEGECEALRSTVMAWLFVP